MHEIRLPISPKAYRLLRKRLFYTRNIERVMNSRLMFGTDDGKRFYLTPLGIVNGLCGVYVWIGDDG